MDDIALLANIDRELNDTLNVSKTVSNNYNTKINIGKTKVIECLTKSGKKGLNNKIDNEMIEEISEFCYLGSNITRDGRRKADIRSRIGQNKKAFAKLPQSLGSNIEPEIRKKLHM